MNTAQKRIAVSLALRWIPVLLLACVLVAFARLSPRFLTLENLQAILVQSSWLVVVALGANFVLLTGGVDLSAGMMMYLAAVLVGLEFAHAPALIAAMAVGIAGFGVGALNGWLVVRFGLPAFVVTLAIAFVGRGLALFLSSTKMVFAGPAVTDLGRANLVLPAPLLIAAGALLVAWTLLCAVPFGRYVLAVGADREGARRAGVPTLQVIAGAYCVSGVFAGIGGFISLSQTSAASATFGQGAEFSAIAAAVLGGTSLFGGRGSLQAPIIGAVLIMTVQNGLVMTNANPYVYPLVTGAVIFLAALLDSIRLGLAARLGRRRFISGGEEEAGKLEGQSCIAGREK